MKTIPSTDLVEDKPLSDEQVAELMADDMLQEYDVDYSQARPNRFVERADAVKTVKLDADVAAVFQSEEAVNTILRALIQSMPQAARRETA